MIKYFEKLILVAVYGLILTACGSKTSNIPSLAATSTPEVEEVSTDEEAVIAFEQCMREEGVEYLDPVVDSDGFVQAPQLVEGVIVSHDEMEASFEVCGELIENMTFARAGEYTTIQDVQFEDLINCMREKVL